MDYEQKNSQWVITRLWECNEHNIELWIGYDFVNNKSMEITNYVIMKLLELITMLCEHCLMNKEWAKQWTMKLWICFVNGLWIIELEIMGIYCECNEQINWNYW